MDYNSYAYLYPPRPEQKIPQGLLGFYEKRKWIAQVKKNGTNTVIFVKGDQFIVKTRHNDDHKMWTPLDAHKEFFAEQCAGEGWNVFCAELLHSKTPHIKNHLYIYDQIVNNGKQLVGSTLLDRHALLRLRFTEARGFGEFRDRTMVSEHVSIAKNIPSDFKVLFDTLMPEDEGLVLKDPYARLETCFKPTSNDKWQVKSRIQHKNYGF
jgi:hypothetical protein